MATRGRKHAFSRILSIFSCNSPLIYLDLYILVFVYCQGLKEILIFPHSPSFRVFGLIGGGRKISKTTENNQYYVITL